MFLIDRFFMTFWQRCQNMDKSQNLKRKTRKNLGSIIEKRKTVTLRDVAQNTNVSMSTVSRVIRNDQYIGENTKLRVTKAIKDLNYKPNSIARRLKYGRTYTIGFILPDISNIYFSSAVRAATNFIENSEYAQYELLFYNTDGEPEREKKAIDFFISRQMEGIIIASTASAMVVEHIRQILNNRQVVFVSIDNQLDDLNIDLIAPDNFHGAYSLTKHLLGLDHRSIAVITGPLNESSSKERLDGYKTALDERGISFNEEICLAGDWTKESGIAIVKRLLKMNPRPTAIFGFNNSMSLGALMLLKEREIRVPEEMALVSFDDVEYGDLLNPALTTTTTSWYELGRVSAEVLLDRINKNPSRPKQLIRLPEEMIIRESCGYRIQ